MTSPIVDFSEIDLTGKVQFGSETIGSVYYNNERIWPFGVDLLYAGNTAGASYLPDASDTYSSSSLASFGEGVLTVLDEKNGTPVIGPELLVNGNFDTDTSWTKGSGWSISSGQATFSSPTAAAIFQAIPVVAGRWYKVTMNVVSMNGYFDFRLGESSVAVATMVGVGERSYVVSATSSSWMAFLIYGPDNGSIVIDSVSIREISGLHAHQAAVALRPLVGRAPKSRRNLLTWTEDLTNPGGWSAASATVSASSITHPTGAQVWQIVPFAGSYIPATGTGVDSTVPATVGLTNTYSVDMRAGGYPIGILIFSDRANVYGGVAVNLTDGTVTEFTGPNSDVLSNATVTSLGDGWYRVSFTHNGGGAIDSSNGLRITAAPAGLARYLTYVATTATMDGTSGIYVARPQRELGSITTAYQSVGVAVNITEQGVPSYPFIRFDLSDDRLDTVLPQAVTGDVVIAGRSGSVITPQSYTANTTFQLGPTSYTGGTPGILRAIGDVVGWSILNKTLTAAERERLMRFYKRRGAKGLLVPGPELVVNGGFETDLSGWSSDTSWFWENGAARHLYTPTNRTIYQGTTTPGRAYLVTYSVVGFLNGGQMTVLIGGAYGASVRRTDGSYSEVVVAANSSGWGITAGGTWQGSIDNISVRELRPEEEW